MKFFVCLALLGTAPAIAASWQFHGELASVQSSGQECDTVFTETSYHTRVFAVGPTHRTAVIHFENQDQHGTLHRQSLTGLHGGTGDIQVEKTIPLGANRLEIVASGLFAPDVLLLRIEAVLRPSGGGDPVCRAQADYSGFAD